MTEEIKYYTGNCITDLHTDTSISHCNEKKCKQYTKSDGLNFCMSSVCPEKDCIYALVYKLHQKVDCLEQENKDLIKQLNALKPENVLLHQIINKYESALEEIRKECKCYGRQRGSNREFDREYGGELHINIIEQINEVLE